MFPTMKQVHEYITTHNLITFNAFQIIDGMNAHPDHMNSILNALWINGYLVKLPNRGYERSVHFNDTSNLK
jgi:hypothetical protein